MGDLFRINVDDREQMPSPDIRVTELAKLNVPATVQRLPVGDYQWMVQREDGRNIYVVVERKSIGDLLSSAQDGRLARFIDDTGGQEPDDDLLRSLLVEGDQFIYGTYGYKDWSPEQVDNILASMQRFGVIVLRSAGVAKTAARLASFWRYTGKDEHTSLLRVVRPETSGYYMNPNKKAAVRALMCLPGLGEQRARAVLESIGSVGKAVELFRERDVKAFKEVKGVGKGLVIGIADFLEENYG